MPIYDNIGGTWRTVSKPYTNVGGVWKESKSVYDNIGGTWRKAHQAIGVWSTGGNILYERRNGGGFGTQGDAIKIGGTHENTVFTAQVERWNGSSWYAINVAYYESGSMAFGTTSAGVSCGGYDANSPYVTNRCSKWNGSSWSDSGNLIASRRSGQEFGIQGAGVVASGENNSISLITVEHFNGSSWASANNLPATRVNGAGCGTQTSGLVACGNLAGGITETCIKYNGSGWWSTGNALRVRIDHSLTGTQTCAVMAGGWTYNNSPYIGHKTEEFSGDVWFTSGDGCGRVRHASAGSGTQTVSFGGTIDISGTIGWTNSTAIFNA